MTGSGFLEVLTGLPAIAAAMAVALAGIVALAILAAITLLSWCLTVRRRTISALRAGREDAGVRIPPAFLFLFTPIARRIGERFGPEAVRLMGVDRLWTASLSSRPRISYLRLALRYAPDTALYPALEAAAGKPALRVPYSACIASRKDPHVILKTAISADGRTVPGSRIIEMLTPNLPEIRALAGNPDWKIRFFAYQILVHDPDPVSLPLCADGLGDPDYRIRTMLVSGIRQSNPKELFGVLFPLLASDPVRSVRSAVKKRLLAECPKEYRIMERDLVPEQAARILENLTPGCVEDERLAVAYLASDDLELRLPAALFLDSTGFLLSLFRKPIITDKGEMDRVQDLLSRAVDVHACRFLSGMAEAVNPGTLLLASRLAKNHRGIVTIRTLAEKVFLFFSGKGIHGPYEEIYRNTIEVLGMDGDAESLSLLVAELKARAARREEISELLAALPPRHGEVFVPALLSFLRDPSFPCHDSLRAALARLPLNAILPEILSLLVDQDPAAPSKTHVEAVKLLAELRLPYCVRIILENLRFLSPDEARRTIALVVSSAPAELEKHAFSLLSSSDSLVRAALLSALPASGRKSFVPAIRKGLSDPDSRIRIASIQALADYGDTRLVPLLLPLLRDQSAEVRNHAAYGLAVNGNYQGLAGIRMILFDKNEVEPVKEAAVLGLGKSEDREAVAILMEKLAEDSELQDCIIAALARKTDRKDLERIMELYPDLPLGARKRLSALAANPGPVLEANLLSLLSEERSNLRESVISFLESGGFTVRQVTRLSHREPGIRKQAAEILSVLATQDSYRGLVIAARDSVQDVSDSAIETFEGLPVAERERILEGLSEDPDRRVRKNARWLVERLATKER